MTKVIEVDRYEPEQPRIHEAAQVLRSGGLVAFPTETVYGLGALALDPIAVRKIFAAKGRPDFNPLIAHVASTDAARKLAARWPQSARLLADAFWPGPLTLVLPKQPHVPDEMTAALPTVAIRIPAHPIALALLRAVEEPLAAPSANRYTRLSPTTAEHVIEGLGERVDLVIDGGPTEVGIESTVVDLSGDQPRLLRPGVITEAQLEQVLGGPVGRLMIEGDVPRPGPGMVDRHYAPQAELRVYPAAHRETMRKEAAEAASMNIPTGALLLHRHADIVDHPIVMPDNPDDYARALYATLHELDRRGCKVVFADAVPDRSEWDGVRDRLRRASHA